MTRAGAARYLRDSRLVVLESASGGMCVASAAPHAQARATSPSSSGLSLSMTKKLSGFATSVQPWRRSRRAMPRAAAPVSAAERSSRVSNA